MNKRILIVQGHPDASAPHFLHALAASYADGARAAGHEVRTVDLAKLDVPYLRSQQEWEHGDLPASLQSAQADIGWCEHIAIFFPLWLGDMPALVKAFLEQVARPGFAFKPGKGGNAFSAKGLTGRSARVVVTMGMPAFVYRWFFFAHSIKSLKRNILGFVGFGPVRDTVIGGAGKVEPGRASRCMQQMKALGSRAA